MTQTESIKRHLKKKKSITSWEAISLYGATRLGSIIFALRHHKDWLIDTEDVTVKNRFGDSCTIAKYRLVKAGK